ncbi:MAG: prepilin-type N-terminal cleavage/methylation domain-containing protein [Chitinivibrionales bacterium]|nr:prepilin-type N-terminal cleavage/methylation domain-containing protein [Chitinivibrionales bacterium]
MVVRNRPDIGFTLVEILIAASIFSVGIVGFAALVAKGRELDVGDRHRRLARYLIDSCFEDTSYHFSNYANLETLENDYERILDERRPDTTGDELVCTVQVEVEGPLQISAYNTFNVYYKRLIISSRWREPEGMDSIVLEKWLTEVP